MKSKKTIKWQDKAVIIAVLGLAVTNPFAVAYIDMGLEIAVKALIEYAPYANSIAGVVIVAWVVFTYKQATRVNIPSKNSKTNKVNYTE